MDISTIESAIVDALADANTDDAIKTIESYHGDLTDFQSEVGKFVASLPALYVMYTGSVFEAQTVSSFDERQNFSVICVAKDLRAKSAAKMSAYGLIEYVKTVLINNDFGLDIYPLKPIAVTPLLISTLLSVFQIDFETSFYYPC
jgi:phage gp37-like protein